jgi:hypothetical protein
VRNVRSIVEVKDYYLLVEQNEDIWPKINQPSKEYENAGKRILRLFTVNSLH